jgi:hypothetical protein
MFCSATLAGCRVILKGACPMTTIIDIDERRQRGSIIGRQVKGWGELLLSEAEHFKRLLALRRLY